MATQPPWVHRSPNADCEGKGNKKKVMQRYGNHELREVSLDAKDAGQLPPRPGPDRDPGNGHGCLLAPTTGTQTRSRSSKCLRGEEAVSRCPARTGTQRTRGGRGPRGTRPTPSSSSSCPASCSPSRSPSSGTACRSPTPSLIEHPRPSTTWDDEASTELLEALHKHTHTHTQTQTQT
jgi:hypothetical protein